MIRAMKMNVHLRFAAYVFLVTAGFASLILPWYTDANGPWGFVALMCIPSARKLIGEDRGFFFNPQRPVSDRALFFGFLGFLVVFWVGALFIAFHLNPQNHPMRVILPAIGLMWLAFLYPGYRQWRIQKREAAS